MTAYKESGIKWLGKIPAHWEIKPLKYLGFLYSGLSGKKGKDFSKDKIQDFKPYIPFINICKNHYLDNELLHYVKIEENEIQNKVLKYDLFFMSSSETKEEIGKNAIYLGDEKELYLNSFCRGFRFTSNEINPLFINYLLSSKTYRYYFSSSSNGDIRINLKKEIIENLLVLLPPLEEQEKIAKYLDDKCKKIDDFVIKQTKFIELLKEQKQVLINQATTKGLNKSTELKDSHIPHLGKIPTHWEVVKLGKICSVSSGGTPSRANNKYWENGTIKWLGSTVCKNTKFVECDCEYITQEGLENSSAKIFHTGTILLALVGATIGKIAYLNFDAATNQNIAGIVPLNKNILSNNYLFYCLLTSYPCFVEQSNNDFHMANLSFVRELLIVLPPLEEQEKIAKYLDEKCEKIDKAINNITKQISLIQEYKTSLIDTTTKGMLKGLK